MSAPPDSGLVALVVDDREVDRLLLVSLLKYRGYSVLEAADGASALALAEAEHPDVIVTDVALPGMGGHELIQRVRADPELAGVPVVLCSAYFTTADAASAAGLGVASILPKPVEPASFAAALDRATAWRSEHDPDAPERRPTAPDPPVLEMFRQSETPTAARAASIAAMLDWQEADRRRTATQIHDDTIPLMARASLRLQALRSVVAPDDALSDTWAEVSSAVESAIEQLRALVLRLGPPPVPDLSLADALRSLAAGAPFEFVLVNQLTRQPSEPVVIGLYRIAQEALSNASLHARATRVVLHLMDARRGISMSIVDDGTGCEPERLHPGPGHLGITSMRARAKALGGQWGAHSTPGGGTSVEVWVPG